MVKLRLRFLKQGRAIYISQLDLMRTLQRAFQRAGYPLKYSEGFNPHPLLSVALPMSVGMSSVCEILDFKMNEEPDDFNTMKESITSALPEGLEIIDIYYPERKVNNIKWLRIRGMLEYDSGVTMALMNSLRDHFAQDSINVMKKSKRGETLFDLKPHFREMMITEDSDCVIKIEVLLSAQNPTVNPNYLIKSIPDELKPDFARFFRLELYDENLQVFS